ncbi:MAG: glycosyltransferase family 9 protein [Candidatus Omnitrophica bacterium]|nr:glycosyltransferase family 9 protein [Candidatus Omnitrophota bacterium]
MILTTPVVTSLRKSFPEACLTVVVGPKAAPVLEKSRQIDRLLIYDKRAGWSHKIELVKTLRETAYDWVVDLRNSLLPFLVQTRHRSPIFRFFRSPSVRVRHLEILKMMELPTEDGTYFDFFSEEDERNLDQKLGVNNSHFSKNWVVIAPGAGSELKRWKIENFREVLARLLKISSLSVVITGDSNEAELGSKLAAVDPERVVNLAGEINLRELAALLSRAKFILSNDSACMHLGYELRRPVIAIFGPTHHEKYGRKDTIWKIVREFPPCAPCEKAQCRFERRYCLDDLSIDKVFQACEELLAEIE